MSKKIFISYRRDDAKADARDLHNRLRRFFGRSNVFMDVDNLLAGQRFDHQLDAALKQCDTLLAVIGPRWSEILNERVQNQERDYVCEEIAGALERKIAVIPVLVDGAELPGANDLPPNIQELTYYQKHDITHERFGRDVETLVADIKAVRKFNNGSSIQTNFARGLAAVFAVVGVVALGWYVTDGGKLAKFIGANSPAPVDMRDQQEAGRTEAIQKSEQLRRAAEEQQKAEREAEERRKVEAAKQAKLEAELNARKEALNKAKAELQPGGKETPYEQWRRANALTEVEAQRRLNAEGASVSEVQTWSPPSDRKQPTSLEEALRQALDRPKPPMSSSTSTYITTRVPTVSYGATSSETPYEQWLRLNSIDPNEADRRLGSISKSAPETEPWYPSYQGKAPNVKEALRRALDRPKPPASERTTTYYSDRQPSTTNENTPKETPYEAWRRLNSASSYDRQQFSPVYQGSTYQINRALERALDRPKPPTR